MGPPENKLLNHSIKVGKCFVSKEKQLAVGQLNKEYAAKRTLEEYVKGSGWIKQKDFKTTFQRGTKITPLFKATVWYGK